MNKLIIIRGPSGSGKSTIAKSFGFPVYETDNFWINAYGEYIFDVNKLGLAHETNQKFVEQHMASRKHKDLIISNTSIQLWEMEPYLEMAEKYGYEVEIIRTPKPWDANVLFNRNVHNVPLKTIQRQINKYQEHPDETEFKSDRK